VTLYKLSIERPVLATVMSLVLVIFGLVSSQRLGVREFPAVDPPIITVTTSYPGAPPEVIESQITEPLEEKINAVAGIRTMTSVSREGSSMIRVEFKIGADLERAANDVRDKVASAQRSLPPDADPPTVTKSDADRQPVAFINVYSPERDLLEISDIAERRVKPALETIDQVAEVSIWGQKRYAMRVWLDRDKLAAYGLTPVEVRAALARENLELPSGRIDGRQVELSVRAATRFTDEAQFNDMIIRRTANGVVRLKDVGEARLGPENLRNLMKRNGAPSVGVVLRPQPGANQIAIVDEMYRRLKTIQNDLPEDVQLSVGFDTTQYVRASIREVGETVLVAVMLVVAVIFMFLRTWRSTLVPAVVIPVSLLGGFFVMDLAGYSINVLTLLAMVLAIGLVVDDAILVLENIYRKFEHGLSAHDAGVEGTKEVFTAVIATTVSLVAVFVPIFFLGGLVGKLFREFAVVMAGSIIVSAFVALTLTPMLCTKVLGRRQKPSRFYNLTEPFFVALTEAYRRVLRVFLRVRWLAFPLLIGAGLATWTLFRSLESELAPLEDRGNLRINATAPEGASFDYMLDYMDELSELVAEEVPESDIIISQTAPGFGGSGTVNSGFVRVFLVKRAERTRSQQEIANALLVRMRDLPGARSVVIQEPTINLGGGGGLPVQFVIQAQDFEKLREALPHFLERAQAHPAFSRVDVDLKFNKPQARVEIDRERAQALGVSAADIGETLNLALAEQRFGYFLREGRQYYVIGALMREQRDANPDLRSLYVPSRSGYPVRLDNVARMEEEIAPPQLFRFNRYTAATVSASLSPGYSLSQGIAVMQSIADEVLDDTFETDLAGEGRDLRETGAGTLFAFLLALALIYLALAAQFESFRDPLTILLTVPLALAGAAASLWLTGQTINIFSQIGMVMLIGLVTKNGILIVEFANQQRARGLGIMEATLEASAARLRPVLMTSVSTILGILPIALALGAGSESRRSMGIAVVGGLALSTALTLLIIPAVYTFMATRRFHRTETES
jgi:multidrug efflux pump